MYSVKERLGYLRIVGEVDRTKLNRFIQYRMGQWEQIEFDEYANNIQDKAYCTVEPTYSIQFTLILSKDLPRNFIQQVRKLAKCKVYVL